LGSVFVVAPVADRERFSAPYAPRLVWSPEPGDSFFAPLPGETPSPPWVSLIAVDTDIRLVLGLVARHFNWNFLSHADVRGNVTVRWSEVSEDEVLHLIARANGFEVGILGSTLVLAPPHRLPHARDIWRKAPVRDIPGKPVTLDEGSISAHDLYQRLGQAGGIPFRAAGIDGRFTISFKDKPAPEVAELVAGLHGWKIEPHGEGISVTGSVEGPATAVAGPDSATLIPPAPNAAGRRGLLPIRVLAVANGNLDALALIAWNDRILTVRQGYTEPGVFDVVRVYQYGIRVWSHSMKLFWDCLIDKP